jgi:hypothetical protein
VSPSALTGPPVAPLVAVQDGDTFAAEIRRRLESVRSDLVAYFDAAHPSLVAVRETIERALDDTAAILDLASDGDDFWMMYAAQQLASAEAQFINAQTLIERYGGVARPQVTPDT